MSYQGKLKRYSLIIEKVSSRPNCSFKELYDFLFEEGFEISSRTLQRDIEQIRHEFSIEINYDSAKNGYFIKNDEGTDIEGFLQLLSINDTNVVLMESVKQGNSLMKFVQFDKSKEAGGAGHIKSLLDAARKQKRVTLHHKGFESETAKEYVLEPYLLKEYEGRWYVWGKIEGKKEFRIFGLDRVKKISVSNKKFDRDKKTDPHEIFAHTLGVNYTRENPEEIELSFSPFIGKYIKALPLHHTQEILKDSEKEFRIRLYVRPNHELKKMILGYGPDVKVNSPKSLGAEIKSLLKKAAKQYD